MEWEVSTFGGAPGGGTVATVTSPDALGAVRIAAPTAMNNTTTLEASGLPLDAAAADAWWYSARLHLDDLTNMQATFGVRDAVGVNLSQALFQWSPGIGVWRGIVGAAGVYDVVPFSDELNPVVDTYQTFDILLAPGRLAAFYVNGNGPLWTKTNVPNAPLTPFVTSVHSTAVGSAVIHVDRFKLVAIKGDIADPSGDFTPIATD